MDEITVALISLAGAVVGGGLTGFAQWISTRSQVKADREREAYREEAALLMEIQDRLTAYASVEINRHFLWASGKPIPEHLGLTANQLHLDLARLCTRAPRYTAARIKHFLELELAPSSIYGQEQADRIPQPEVEKAEQFARVTQEIMGEIGLDIGFLRQGRQSPYRPSDEEVIEKTRRPGAPSKVRLNK